MDPDGDQYSLHHFRPIILGPVYPFSNNGGNSTIALSEEIKVA